MLSLSPALASDADSIASIHMAALGNNAMLLAQFPTTATRHELKKCIAEKALADSQDPMVAVLVVRDQDEIIGFAKWHRPVTDPDYVECPWRWPQGTNRAVLDMWTGKVEATKHKILGEAPFYSLSFIGTHPSHERRGAASLLLQWGLERCEKEGVPAYLESTINAGPLYKKHGFDVVDTIAMTLDSSEDGDTTYRETCFLYRPAPKEAELSPVLGLETPCSKARSEHIS